MASGPLSLAVGEPIRNEKIPKSQQRSAVLQSVAPQLRDAAERGAAAPIASISDFLSSLSEGAKNPKANMNAMRLLIETRQTRPKDAQSPASAARDAARDEDAVLFRSGDVTITASHHDKMNRVSEGRHERCRKSWKSNAVIHPFSCMVATSISDIDGIISEHTQLKRAFDSRKERKRQAGAIEASKQAVAARIITPIFFYEKPAVLGEIAQYECAFYKLDPKAFMQDKLEKEGGEWSIEIEVQALTGDPNLIISVTSKYPTDKDFTWRSMGEGDDKIVITPIDPNYPTDGHGHWQTLFIAVPSVSAAACRFHLFASANKWHNTEAEKRRVLANIGMQAAVMSSVSASTERREMASKGRSYQEFLIDSAAPNSNASFTLDKDSSVGARRAKFASTAKDLSLDRQTVCIDDPSSFTQRAMVATFESLTPNVVKRHEELKKIYSYQDPDIKVNIPDPALANLGKGLCDADSSKEGEDAVKIIFKTTLMRPDSGHTIAPKPQKGRDDAAEVTTKTDSNSAPTALLSGERMPDIQWLFRRPPTPYTGVMQKVLESGYGTKQTMRRMMEAFQSVDAAKVSQGAASNHVPLVEDANAPKPFKIITFRGLPLPPPQQSRVNLKRMLTIIQSDWDLRRKGGLIKGDEGMVPVVPIPRKPTVSIKHRDRVALAEAAALGNLKTTLSSLGLAMSSQGALVRAGTEMEIADEDDEETGDSDAGASGKGKRKLKKKAATLTESDDENATAETEQLPPQELISSDSSLLLSLDSMSPHMPTGSGLFKTVGRRPNSNFACVSRPKTALARLGSDHKNVQKLPHHVNSGAMPALAKPGPEDGTALYWQTYHEKLLHPNSSRKLASELGPGAAPPLNRPSSVMSMGPRTSAQNAVLSASVTRPSSSLGLQEQHVDLTKGVSFHMMSPAAEALIQSATSSVSASRYPEARANQTVASPIWTPSFKGNVSACKVPGAQVQKSGKETLQIRPSSALHKKPLILDFVQGGDDLVHTSPLNSPHNLSRVVRRV